MNLALSAFVAYVLVAGYLFSRGVELGRIARVMASGVAGGVALSGTVGMILFLVALQKPIETISVFSMMTLPFSAIYFARDEILGTITPLGIILLNIAANAVDRMSPVPLSFAGLLPYLPVPHGPWRLPLDLLVLYLPSWAALWMLHRGPPGAPFLRYAMGIWVCVVSALSIAGPGWKSISTYRLDDPFGLFASGFAVYAAVHALLLAVNAFASLGSGSDKEAVARSIARSVRVDAMPVGLALLGGLAFWVAAGAWMRTPLGPELKASILLGAALGLGPLLSRRPQGTEPGPGDEVTPRGYSLGTAGMVAVFVGAVAIIGAWTWRDLHPLPWGREASAKPSEELFLGYHEPPLQALLKRKLDEAQVPYRVDMARGREFLRVANVHRDRAKEITAAIDGPPLPNGGINFSKPYRQAMFTAWLDARGIPWRVVTKQLQDFVMVDQPPGTDPIFAEFLAWERAQAARVKP